MYEIYLSAVVECEVEDTIFDLFEFCDKKSCSPGKLLENQLGTTFKIIGIMNAFAAVTYERTVVKSDLNMSKDLHFDLWQEVGKNVGRLFRYSTKFT